MDVFESMRNELAHFDQQREELIIKSRKLLSLAKKAMYNTHRDQLDQAKEQLAEAEKVALELKNSYFENRKYKIGAVTAALQEWGESLAYFVYAQEGRLLAKDACGLETEDYLLALADFTGELTRRAVLAKINKHDEEVRAIRTFVDDLLGSFLSFDFRNGELRKKTDQIRWNLQKIEELLIR